MSETIEVKWLREHGDKEHLGQYDNEWIAVLGQEIIAHDADFEKVIKKAEKVLKKRNVDENPLYYFVEFECEPAAELTLSLTENDLSELDALKARVGGDYASILADALRIYQFLFYTVEAGNYIHLEDTDGTLVPLNIFEDRKSG